MPKKRLVIWPKGSLLFNTHFSAIPLEGGKVGDEDWDSVTLALRLLYYHFHNKRSRIISAEEWCRVALHKMRFTSEMSTVVFSTAQAVLPLERAEKWSMDSAKQIVCMQNMKADLLAIVAVISLLGCRKKSNKATIVRYLKNHMEKLCWLLLLCHYDLAVQHIHSHKYSAADRNQSHLPIPTKALVQLDVLFEGTFLLSIPSSTANIIPHSCSSLLHSIPQLTFARLVEILSTSLQADMFLLDLEENFLQPIKNVRSITCTQYAEHRKISVRNWQHMELLTNSQYTGSNLRLMHAQHNSSPVFHLRWLRTAGIVDCSGVGVVVLGPVQHMLVLKRVRKTSVSVVCPRIWVEQCEDVRLFVNCECAVMMVGEGCRDVRVAPYNVYYDGLAYELDKAGMRLSEWWRNTWDKPVVINSVYSSNSSPSQTPSPVNRPPPCWSILPAQHFYIQPTPFRETYKSSLYKTFLESLPADYQQQWFEETRPLAVKCALQQNALSYELNKQFLRDHMPFTSTDLSYLLRRVERRK